MRETAPTAEEIDSVVFESEKPDRGYTVRASYLKASTVAWVEIFKDGVEVRAYHYPAYKIWNVAAHFPELVDDMITLSEESAGG